MRADLHDRGLSGRLERRVCQADGKDLIRAHTRVVAVRSVEDIVESETIRTHESAKTAPRAIRRAAIALRIPP